MKHIKSTNRKRLRRIARVRATIFGTAERPRLAVRRTNKAMYAQLIDDTAHRTIAAVSSGGKRGTGDKGQGRPGEPRFAGTKDKATKSEQAFAVGEALAKKAVEKKINAAVFDRRAYKFHGRVKSVAEGARKGGLKI